MRPFPYLRLRKVDSGDNAITGCRSWDAPYGFRQVSPTWTHRLKLFRSISVVAVLASTTRILTLGREQHARMQSAL
jgi:hypothetical protein